MKHISQELRVNRIQQLSFKDAEKLIFEWVKTNVINVLEFSELCKANRDSTV